MWLHQCSYNVGLRFYSRQSSGSSGEDENDRLPTERKKKGRFYPVLDIFTENESLTEQPLFPKGAHSYVFEGESKHFLKHLSLTPLTYDKYK